MIRYGISQMPPEETEDAEFLDGLLELGHDAIELPFVHGFPWKEKRCAAFGEVAAERGMSVSIHAPYFAVLTVDNPESRPKTLSAVEHAMKLTRELGGHTVVAHTGYVKGRDPEVLHELVNDGLSTIEPKVRHLGVALGLETTGTQRAFGSLGDIALFAKNFNFVRPVVDWAHVHAMTGGGLASVEGFNSVIAFLRSEFPGWALDPLHTQFTDNDFGPKGEIRHIPYGEGSLRIGPLVEAATKSGLKMTVISEAKEASSHAAILADLRASEAPLKSAQPATRRTLSRSGIDFPDPVAVEKEGDGYYTSEFDRHVKLTNIDKEFWPGAGYTKGDLIQYYASISPVLLPHLAGRPLSLSRYPGGIEGASFYEKQCPGHAPAWMVRAPMPSSHRGEVIEFCTARDIESIVWLANLAAIEMHPWLSRVQHPAAPDYALFDLDPQEGCAWEKVGYVANLINLLLERLGLTGYPKTSGSRGLHILVPLEPEYDYRRVRRFVQTVGSLVVAADPDAATLEWDKPKRGPKVFIDHNQNVGGKTTASAYSVRPKPGAPVSTPVLWSEVESVDPSEFTIATIWSRLRQHGDLYAPVLAGGQRLEAAETALRIEHRGD